MCLTDSLYSVPVQWTCDVEPIKALHGSDSRLHGLGRAQNRHSGVCGRKVAIPLEPCLQKRGRKEKRVRGTKTFTVFREVFNHSWHIVHQQSSLLWRENQCQERKLCKKDVCTCKKDLCLCRKRFVYLQKKMRLCRRRREHRSQNHLKQSNIAISVSSQQIRRKLQCWWFQSQVIW